MTLFEKGLEFATKAHSGQIRKVAETPYIMHPMEVAVIISTVTNDEEVLVAGLLHDTIEDCGVKPQEIAEQFGQRVYDLVMSETEEKMPELPRGESWLARKQKSIEDLGKAKDIGTKILWLGDKLSNVRSFYREYQVIGNKVWEKLNQKDPLMHKWYYYEIKNKLSELSDTFAYKEYAEIIEKLFDGE